MLTALSWVPTSRVGVPAVFILAAMPVVYAIIGPGGPLQLVPEEAPPEAAQPAEAPRRGAAPLSRWTVQARPLAVPKEDDPFYQSFSGMTGELEQRALKHPGQVGIYVKDLKRGWEWSYHSDDLFPSASLIKVPVMIGVFEKIHRGQLTLSSQLAVRQRTRMGGSGSLKWAREGSHFTVRQLLDKLIVESDNTAMRVLLDEIGLGFLQSVFPKMGLIYTEIYPEGLTLNGGRVRQENYTTAREMGNMLESIYRGEVVDRFASELMLEILKGPRHVRSRLAKTLPVGWELAHKTGLLRRACHDAGVVFTPYGDYVLVVLTGRNSSYYAAKEFIADAGKITYRHYRNQESLYAKADEAGAGSPDR